MFACGSRTSRIRCATITVVAISGREHRPMPERAPDRRRHFNREDYAERFARGDSYGLLLALLVVPTW